MIRSASILAAFALLFGLLVAGCGERIGPDESDDLSSNLKLRADLPPSPLGSRTNPLQTYIRDNWTGGDQTSTAGLHYGHIKTYGLMFYDLGDDDEQAEFIVDHFDAYAGAAGLSGILLSRSIRAFSGCMRLPAFPT